MELIPAVDVLDGAAVRLRQGDFDDRFLDAGDPLAVIAGYAAAGARRIHVVDLEGSRSGRLDRSLIGAVVEAAAPAAVQLAGGVRSIEDAVAVIELGAARVVVGTAAIEDPAATETFATALGERLVVAVDVKDGEVRSRGWLRGTGRSALEVATACAEAGVARLLCTAIERDGGAVGPDLDLLSRVVGASALPVIASGGIGTTRDIEAVQRTGAEACVIGRALLDGSLPHSILG